jgi:hypothetical protein
VKQRNCLWPWVPPRRRRCTTCTCPAGVALAAAARCGARQGAAAGATCRDRIHTTTTPSPVPAASPPPLVRRCVVPEYVPRLQWDAGLIISTNFFEHEIMNKMKNVKMFDKPLEPIAGGRAQLPGALVPAPAGACRCLGLLVVQGCAAGRLPTICARIRCPAAPSGSPPPPPPSSCPAAGDLELDLMHLTGRVSTGVVQHATITLPNVGPDGFHKQMGGPIYPPRRGERPGLALPLFPSSCSPPAAPLQAQLPRHPAQAPRRR